MFINPDNYDYLKLLTDLEVLNNKFPFVQITSIGNSVLGRDIYAVGIGNMKTSILYNGAHHALEWITTPILMEFLFWLCSNIERRDIFINPTLWTIPMVNPDGVDLVINGLHDDNPYYSYLLLWNNYNSDFSKTWSANIRGVDLNHNYDAL
jgi:g-D-glutamyl-meso-diaminopimelate peptidase